MATRYVTVKLTERQARSVVTTFKRWRRQWGEMAIHLPADCALREVYDKIAREFRMLPE